MQGHVTPMSKRAMIGSQLWSFTVKFDNFSFAYSSFYTVYVLCSNVSYSHSVLTVSLESLSSDVEGISGKLVKPEVSLSSMLVLVSMSLTWILIMESFLVTLSSLLSFEFDFFL